VSTGGADSVQDSKPNKLRSHHIAITIGYMRYWQGNLFIQIYKTYTKTRRGL